MSPFRLAPILFLSLLLVPLPAAAASPYADLLRRPSDPAALCADSIARVERASGVPARLMQAVSLVESGRQIPGRSARVAWPWTINAQGEGRFFETKAEAVAAVRELQSTGVDSIDVGCMQVNLLYHGDSFASLEQAFDPLANATYAARFLTELHDAKGTWEDAVAHYHSGRPKLHIPYREKVLAEWAEQTARPTVELAAVRHRSVAEPAPQRGSPGLTRPAFVARPSDIIDI